MQLLGGDWRIPVLQLRHDKKERHVAGQSCKRQRGHCGRPHCAAGGRALPANLRRSSNARTAASARRTARRAVSRRASQVLREERKCRASRRSDRNRGPVSIPKHYWRRGCSGSRTSTARCQSCHAARASSSVPVSAPRARNLALPHHVIAMQELAASYSCGAPVAIHSARRRCCLHSVL